MAHVETMNSIIDTRLYVLPPCQLKNYVWYKFNLGIKFPEVRRQKKQYVEVLACEVHQHLRSKC